MGVRGRKARNENKGGGKVEEGTEKGRKETEYSYQRNGGNREKLNGRLGGNYKGQSGRGGGLGSDIEKRGLMESCGYGMRRRTD